MQQITVADHLGVRLSASPPPPALDDQELLVIEGSNWDSTSEWTES